MSAAGEGRGQISYPDASETRWMGQAACAGSSVDFFATDGISADGCKAICASCPVREPCGRFAIRWSEDLGVWGGMTPSERRRAKGRGLL